MYGRENPCNTICIARLLFIKRCLAQDSVRRAAFENPFPTLIAGCIITDPIVTVHSYMRKIPIHLERQILEWGWRDSRKVSIAQK